jgi:ribonuclease BN (tRNA processing enzyme)
MKIHILGCGDAFGSGGRNQSGYLVEADDRLFLLDCGATSLAAMKRIGIDTGQLDAVLLSHLHGDHFAGLPFLFIEYLYQRPRTAPLHIAGPVSTEEKTRELSRLMYRLTDLPPVNFHVLEPENRLAIAGIEVYAFPVPHQTNETSLGLRIAYNGKVILFSGDSAWTDRFLDEARDVDLFLCECTFYDEGQGNHIRYTILKDKLARLRCRRILLTHLGEEMLNRQQDLTIPCASDGMVVEI